MAEIIYFHSPITAVCFTSEFKEVFCEKIQLPGKAAVVVFSFTSQLHLRKQKFHENPFDLLLRKCVDNLGGSCGVQKGSLLEGLITFF